MQWHGAIIRWWWGNAPRSMLRIRHRVWILRWGNVPSPFPPKGSMVKGTRWWWRRFVTQTATVANEHWLFCIRCAQSALLRSFHRAFQSITISCLGLVHVSFSFPNNCRIIFTSSQPFMFSWFSFIIAPFNCCAPFPSFCKPLVFLFGIFRLICLPCVQWF